MAVNLKVSETVGVWLDNSPLNHQTRKRYFFNLVIFKLLTNERTILSYHVLRNTVGGVRVSDFPEKSVTKMYSSTLLVLG